MCPDEKIASKFPDGIISIYLIRELLHQKVNILQICIAMESFNARLQVLRKALYIYGRLAKTSLCMYSVYMAKSKICSYEILSLKTNRGLCIDYQTPSNNIQE